MAFKLAPVARPDPFIPRSSLQLLYITTVSCGSFDMHMEYFVYCSSPLHFPDTILRARDNINMNAEVRLESWKGKG